MDNSYRCDPTTSSRHSDAGAGVVYPSGPLDAGLATAEQLLDVITTGSMQLIKARVCEGERLLEDTPGTIVDGKHLPVSG